VTEDEALARWRTAAGKWAHFLKPSLLIADGLNTSPVTPKPLNLAHAVAGFETALVVELPGTESVAVGVGLGRAGWCVVPMFNTTRDAAEVLPTLDLICALRGAAADLPKTPTGPPAFLLDSHRQVLRKRPLQEGDFDNRWYVFKSDFPSEEFLGTNGIKRLLVVTREGSLQKDLSDALAGHVSIERFLLHPDSAGLLPFPKARPGPWRIVARFGRSLTRNLDGTFGRRYVISHG
jgi:hypothetical protein